MSYRIYKYTSKSVFSERPLLQKVTSASYSYLSKYIFVLIYINIKTNIVSLEQEMKTGAFTLK